MSAAVCTVERQGICSISDSVHALSWKLFRPVGTVQPHFIVLNPFDSAFVHWLGNCFQYFVSK